MCCCAPRFLLLELSWPSPTLCQLPYLRLLRRTLEWRWIPTSRSLGYALCEVITWLESTCDQPLATDKLNACSAVHVLRVCVWDRADQVILCLFQLLVRPGFKWCSPSQALAVGYGTFAGLRGFSFSYLNLKLTQNLRYATWSCSHLEHGHGQDF